MIPVSHYLVVGAALFVIGLIGFLTRRNLIVLFLCAELMLQGVAVNLVAFARFHANLHGQVFTLFMITVAACEAAIALALFVILYWRNRSLDISAWSELREPGQDVPMDDEPLSPREEEVPYPKLPPAGIEPIRDEEATRV